MANTDLNYTSTVSATGWTNPGNVASSNDTRATDGTPAEAITIEIDNAPGDYNNTNTGNTVTLRVEARTQGSVSRPKQITFDLLDSSNNAVLDSGSSAITFSTGNLTATDATYTSSAFTLANNYTSSNVDGWRLRATVTEGGGMADTATVEIDLMNLTLSYAVAGTTHDVSGSDGADAGDTATAPLTVPGGGADGAEAGDTGSIIGTFGVVGTDGAEASDAGTITATYAVAGTDGAEASDTAVAGLLHELSESDGAVATDVATAPLTFPAQGSDGAEASDVASANVQSAAQYSTLVLIYK